MSYLRPVGWKQYVGGMVVNLCIGSGVSAVALYVLRGGRIRNFRSVVQGIVRRDLMFMGRVAVWSSTLVYGLHTLLMIRQIEQDYKKRIEEIKPQQPDNPNKIWGEITALYFSFIPIVKNECKTQFIKNISDIYIQKVNATMLEQIVQATIPSFLRRYPKEGGTIQEIIQNLQAVQPGAGVDDSQEITGKIQLLQNALPQVEGE